MSYTLDLEELYGEHTHGRRAEAPAEKHLRSPILASLLERVRDTVQLVISESEKREKKHWVTGMYRNHLRSIFSSSVASYGNIQNIVSPFIRDHVGISAAPEILYPEQYPVWFSRTLGLTKQLDSAFSDALELYRAEVDAYAAWGTIPEIQKFCEQERTWNKRLSKITYQYYENYRYWDYMVERYRATKLKKDFGEHTVVRDNIRFRFYDGFIVEQHGEPTPIYEKGKIVRKTAPKRWMYTFEQMQMLQDTCLARFNAFLAINVDMHNASSDISALLLRLITWQERILTEYGNKGYELVKGPESVAKSYLTTITSGDVLETSSFERTVEKLSLKEKKLSGSFSSPLTDELVQIVEETKDLWTCAEIFGCTKLSGHPFVYANISAASVREEGCSDPTYDLAAIAEMHCQFKKMVLERYLQKHKVWPKFLSRCEPRPDTQLHHLWTQGVIIVPPTAYPSTDFLNVEFGKFMEFDYSPDYLDMIDDKAICPGGKEASGFWFPRNATKSRRLLESLIKTPDIDTLKIVERMRKGNFYLDERIIELTQKEREFKTSARCFCKLTFEVRLFFVLTEANLKRFMGGDSGDNGYMPQQTMTMSSQKLRKRLYDLTINTHRPNSCLVELDFTRWNLRWRAASVNPISRTLERIFGLPGVFSQAHNFFASSTIVLTDKHSLPTGITPGLPAHKWPVSDLVWRNHTGGFEGIQQTLWTICTVSMMYYAMKDENCSFQMAGQGDNQVFHLTFNTKRDDLSVLLDKYLKNVERACARLNHEVKPEECVDSKTVLTYGKEIYVKGVHIMYSLKFSSRAFARLDHSIPSLTKEISGVVSNSIAVSGTLKNSFRAILWKFLQVLLLLHRRRSSPINRIEWNAIDKLLNKKVARQTLLIPGSLGGLPMMPWTRYFSRGETDDLSFDTAATYYLSRGVPLIKNYMYLLRMGEFTPHEIDATNLINDPHSIPVDRPDDASHLVADAVGRALPNIVKNRDLKPLVLPALRAKGEEYKKFLLGLQPLHPEIVSDLFKITPAGLYEKTVKRFSMTRTIEKIAPSQNVSEKIVAANAKFLGLLLSRVAMSTREVGQAHPPPFETAQQLRDMWKLGLKNSSIGIYTPFDFPVGHMTRKKFVVSAAVDPDADLFGEPGVSPPNFGTTTSQKKSEHGYRIANCNSTIRDLKSAILMYSELQGDSSITPTVESIINARSPWTLSQLLPLFPTVYGGTAVHRHAASRHNFAMLGSCSVPTHVSLSSDNAGILSGGEFDYPVVFQTLFLTLTNIYQLLESSGIRKPSSIAYHIPNELCTIDTSPSKSINIPKKIQWPKLNGNRLAWTDQLFASEVPLVPNPDIVPHTTYPLNKLDLVYSYLETKVSVLTDSMRVWDGILSPLDIFDFKEISRVDPVVVEQALSWTLITDVLHEFLHRREEDMTIGTLDTILRRRSMIYAGMWVRIRLHPMFSESSYNQSRQVCLQVGREGYKRPVEYMASKMRNVTKNLISRDYGATRPTLILFNNWKESSKYLSTRRLILAHTIATYPHFSWKQLRDEINRGMPPKELLDRDPVTALLSATRPISKTLYGREYHIPEMKSVYINASPEEAMRSLRTNRSQIDKALPRNRGINISNHGMVEYETTYTYGTRIPQTTQNTLPDDVRIRVLMRRTIGISSPLYSDWNAVISVLNAYLPEPSTSTIHLFGVGRGATARVFTELGFVCIGYDLRTTFPTVAQRDASYKPPELLYSNNPQNFAWSDHTHLTNGDIRHGDLDIEHDEHSLAVIDLDLPVADVVEIVHRISTNSLRIVRIKGNDEEVRYGLSSLRPAKVISLVTNGSSPVDVVLVIPRDVAAGYGNPDAIRYRKINELTYRNKTREYLEQLWNTSPTIARHLGIEVSDDIDDVSNQLREIYTTNDRELTGTDIVIHSILHRRCPSDYAHGRYMRIYAVLHNIMNNI
ncbi:MAG: RNA-dependent RNA polymerase [Alternaria tenuissima negative-stranded RNA virus 1]|uniref:RNA-dependent RNA polymerase n=1 Tax=Alternaria tenuissima negative-stranded RNA virus 1 TaxID=2587546 RepID=UPI002481C89A|nr:MAG: RNA-dependent RNA polymerase [Alternaria tenuissima negative-stranded RNA virus 1]QDB75013.1 MAG: RNA-dependent RNA polymerase [Alternaria tenuissima negative-stranded RNA virus 1]